MDIRPTTERDMPALQAILASTALFPGEMLPDMISGFLTEAEACIWLTATRDHAPIGFCYAVPEPMAEGTWNMRAIAVLQNEQGRGCGSALVDHLRTYLIGKGARILIVDTSGTEAFAPARMFYLRNAYTEEARIRDFWAAGDDKIVFRISLSA